MLIYINILLFSVCQCDIYEHCFYHSVQKINKNPCKERNEVTVCGLLYCRCEMASRWTWGHLVWLPQQEMVGIFYPVYQSIQLPMIFSEAGRIKVHIAHFSRRMVIVPKLLVIEVLKSSLSSGLAIAVVWLCGLILTSPISRFCETVQFFHLFIEDILMFNVLVLDWYFKIIGHIILPVTICSLTFT